MPKTWLLAGRKTRRGQGMTIAATGWYTVYRAAAALPEWMPESWSLGLARTYLLVPTPLQAAVVVGSATPFIHFQF